MHILSSFLPGMGRIKRGVTGLGKRLCCGLLALLMVLSLFPVFGFAHAAGQKQAVQRAIAIVFDNSGSMYASGNMAWCQATYAVEVFAAMMNEGDVLEVYPMHPVTVDGTEYTMESPFRISNPRDAKQIEKMKTVFPNGTPIQSIGAAYAGLKKLAADERWLVVLTDGDTFDDGQDTLPDTKGRLSEELSGKDVNVAYLGIGSGAAMPEIQCNAGFRALSSQAKNSSDILQNLTEMSNQIFGRQVLSEKKGTVSFDVSMSKLFVFVQGENIANVSLDGAGAAASELATHYSLDESNDRYPTIRQDTSLQGMLITYGQTPKGAYDLTFTGNESSVAVYYEPNVDLVVALCDANGTEISDLEGLYPGEYTLHYGLIDAMTGEGTESKLLGDKNFTISYTVNGQEETVSATENGEIRIELAAGDTLDGSFRVEYLDGYVIHKTGDDLGWPTGGIYFNPRPAGSLVLQLSGPDQIKLSQVEETEFTVKLDYDGEPLKGGGLDQAELEVTVDGGSLGYEVVQKDEGFAIALRHNGAPEDTEAGDYTIAVTAKYTNEDGQTAESNRQSQRFHIEDDSYGLGVKLQAKQKFYVISKMEEGQEILAVLSKDGAPLTDEELAAVSYTVDCGGLQYEAQPVPGESAIAIRLKKDGAKAGSYAVKFSASAKDPLGKEITGEDSVKIELQHYPKWLRIALYGLLLLLLLLLVWLYMNTKVLPKKITVKGTVFTVDGQTVAGTANCKYVGSQKKSGSLDITAPKCMANPLAKGGIQIQLKAVSPRRTKSAQRMVKVTGVSAVNKGVMDSMKVGPKTFIKDPTTGKITMSGAKPGTPVDFDMGTNAKCVFSGTLVDGTSISLIVNLKYF